MELRWLVTSGRAPPALDPMSETVSARALVVGAVLAWVSAAGAVVLGIVLVVDSGMGLVVGSSLFLCLLLSLVVRVALYSVGLDSDVIAVVSLQSLVVVAVVVVVVDLFAMSAVGLDF